MTTDRTVVPTLFPPPGYAHAAVVEAGTRLAFMAGSVPLDPEGKLVGEGDVARQTEQVIANLDEALRAVGSDLSQVVASTVYVVSTEPALLSEAWEVVRGTDLHAGPHTSTLLGTACLGYPGQLVEITATAVVPDGPRAEEAAAAVDDVALRLATEADGAAVADVYLRSFDAALPSVRRAHSAAAVREFFQHVVVVRGSTWIAEAGGEAVGMMVLDGDELSQLYLAPEWRGRGIGDRFVALAKERCPAGLWLRTFQVNGPAHRFYERHGFVATERTDGSGNEEREPDVRYDWRP